MTFERLMADWDGFAVVSRFEHAYNAWFFIAFHDLALGPAMGGTRMKVYDHPEEGLRDAMRLAEGMTWKWAVIGLDLGGGKGVIALSRPVVGPEQRDLLERYGRLVASLRGAFATGQDLGTGPEEMRIVADTAGGFVHGVSADGTMVDPGPFTARGVVAGIRAAVKHRFGADDLSGRSVLIQGVGDVGRPLATILAADGAKLLLSDLDPSRIEPVAASLGAAVVPPDQVYRTRCDVYAPCAIGATINSITIPELACAIVAGSANNQLAEPADAEQLRERGILYVPDYVINAGGAIAFGMGLSDEAAILARVDRIGETVAAVLSEASANGGSPLDAARRIGEEKLARARRAVSFSG